MKRALVPLLAALLSPLPAGAVDEAVYRSTAGRWLVAPEAGGRGCILTLSVEPGIGGRQVGGAEACRGAVARVADAAAWDFDDGGIVFRDALRKRILVLGEREDATWREAAAPGAALVMLPAVGAIDRIPTAREAFGAWDMRRPGGEALCSLRLLDRPPPGGEESYGLTLAKGCDPAILRLKLASWRFEGLELMLYGTDGASLAFVPRPDGGFAKAEREGGKPLLLVRRP